MKLLAHEFIHHISSSVWVNGRIYGTVCKCNKLHHSKEIPIMSQYLLTDTELVILSYHMQSGDYLTVKHILME